MKMLQGKINSNTFYRQEINGITIYHLLENSYEFYKDIYINSNTDLAKIDFSSLVTSNDINLSLPLCVCCLVESTCNLDCIYCFGDDKMYNNKNEEDIEAIYSGIIYMHPLQISLGGGEPTLNPNLSKIIDFISKKDIAIILDTNGTISFSNELISTLKRTDTLVRFSIDSLDDDIIEKIRPFKNNLKVKASCLIKENIDFIINSEILLTVQTVLTQQNILYLEEIADYLIYKKIKRWHISAVKFSEKCRDKYNNIKISRDNIIKIKNTLKKYEKYINITYAFEEDYGANARLLFDVNGAYLTDSITNGLSYLGRYPSLDELYSKLDKDSHIKRYLGDFYI